MLVRVIVWLWPVHWRRGHFAALLADWRKRFCVGVFLGISGFELWSNGPWWEVLQEQIRRCYPVNKEPAETSCQQQRGETCDFKHGHMTDSW